jgi:hypothetical protein
VGNDDCRPGQKGSGTKRLFHCSRMSPDAVGVATSCSSCGKLRGGGAGKLQKRRKVCRELIVLQRSSASIGVVRTSKEDQLQLPQQPQTAWVIALLDFRLRPALGSYSEDTQEPACSRLHERRSKAAFNGSYGRHPPGWPYGSGSRQSPPPCCSSVGEMREAGQETRLRVDTERGKRALAWKIMLVDTAISRA